MAMRNLAPLPTSSGIRTTPAGYYLTTHALVRAMERGYGMEDIDFALSVGAFFRDRADRTIHYVPETPFAALDWDERYTRLQGLAIVLAPNGTTVVTLFRRDWRFAYGSGE